MSPEFWAMLFAMVPKIFISYSQRDEMWRNELVRHLRVLERGGPLRIWDTSEIAAGSDWANEIRQQLERADLAVILVSPDALASDFIVEGELPALLRRQRKGELVVVPVLLRPSPWTVIEGFAELQFANSPSRPIAELSVPERDAVLGQIAERIWTLAQAVAQQKQSQEVGEPGPRGRSASEAGGNGKSVYFISHAREDGDFAELLKLNLERKGHSGWIDTDRLMPGIEWREEIDKTIKDCIAVMAIMSPEARASEYVTYEWAFARGAGKTIIPLMLRQTSLHPRLATLQYLDFSNRMNRPWDRLYQSL